MRVIAQGLVAFTAIALVTAVLMPVEAEQPRRVFGGERLRVLHRAQHRELAKLALEEGGDALDRLSGMLGVEPPRRIDVFIVASQEEFDELTGDDRSTWTLGMALPSRLRVVVKPMGPQRLPRLLAHELAHVMLEVRMGEHAGVLPRWLHEGIAQYAEGGLQAEQRRVIARAALSGELLTIGELDEAFGGDPERVALAYAQSFTLVEYLGSLRPAEGVDPLLTQLAKGRDVRLALGLAYGRPVPEMQREWLTRLRRGYATALAPPWSETLVGLLFVTALVIAVVMVRRRSARIRRRMKQEERARELLGEVPPGGFTLLPDEYLNEQDAEREDDADDGPLIE